MMDKHEQDLVWKLIDRVITNDELIILESRLEDDSELRLYYQNCIETNLALGNVATVRGYEEREAGGRFGGRRFYQCLAAVACLVGVLSLSGVIRMPMGQDGEELVESPQAIKLAEGIYFLPHRELNETTQAYDVAYIERFDLAQGEGDAILPYRLTSGVLDVAEGGVELVYPSGTTLSLYGPARFELIDRDSAWLHRGTLEMVKEGSRHFTVFHEQGRVVDVGTSFVMKIEEGNGLDVFVRDGIVDVYDKNSLGLHRLEKGGALSKDENGVELRKGEAIPSWVNPRSAHVESLKVSASSEQIEIQTVTWLDGHLGQGRAYGILNGVGVRLKGPTSANGGGLYDLDWANWLPVFEKAEKWYHAESAAIGCEGNAREEAVIEFDQEVVDPILLFGWAENGLKIDLEGLSLKEEGFFPAHGSTQLTEEKVLEFGKGKELQNRAWHAAAVSVKGSFGPERPLKFELNNELEKGESIVFSIALSNESQRPRPAKRGEQGDEK